MKLGQPITFTKTLMRKDEYRRNDFGWNERYREWKTEELREPKNGIIIGYRNLSNGRADYEHECGWLYTPQSHFKALVVVTSLRSKPIIVPMSELPTEIEKP